MVDERLRHRAYTREVGDDMPDMRDWTWPGDGGGGDADRRAARRAGLTARVRVLVVNAGSSSLKLRLLDADDALRRAARPARAAGTTTPGWSTRSPSVGAVDAVGHRVVHGGERFRDAVRGRRRP